MKFPLILKFLLAIGIVFQINLSAEAAQNVKVQNRQLMEDFDQNGVYKPFFVKGVNYSPIPIGSFIGSGEGWYALCKYNGPYPLNYPDLRFDPNSPDAASQCGVNGSNEYQDLNVLDRDFALIKSMNANTIRVWSKNITPQLLQKANQYGLKIVTVYWVDHNIDYTFPNPSVKQTLINDFVSYVNTYKNDPAILMWGISNENNLNFCNPCNTAIVNCNRNAQAQGYFTLMNDMALAAKQAEGSSFHPSTIVIGNWSQDVVDYKNTLTAIDIIGFNAYYGDNFDLHHQDPPNSGNWVKYSNLFVEAANQLPNKGILITEFGVDAWNTNGHDADPQNGFEDQTSQADWDAKAWDEIVSYTSGGQSNGGIVYTYSDFWNGYAKPPVGAGQCTWVSSDWTPSVRTQDHGFTNPSIFGFGSFPDERENKEWWGIVALSKNSSAGGIDIATPRQAYTTLKNRFTPPKISFKESASIGYESATSVAVTVNLDHVYETPVTINVRQTTPATATPDDYHISNPSLTFQPGETGKNVVVVLFPDEDGDETLTLELYNPSQGTLGAITKHTVTIKSAPVGCFIATAAYGSPIEPEVQSLRDFRDSNLLAHKSGEEIINWYYHTSPPLADELSKHKTLRTAVRTALNPLIKFCQWFN